MFKKPFLILLLFGLLSPRIINAQWRMESCPTRNNLNAISLSTNNTCWIVGDKGTILFGKNHVWSIYKNNITENLYGIFMLNENNCWAVGAKGTIIHFDGNNWKSVDSPTKKDLFSLYFKDPDNGIVVGESGTILYYKDGTWMSVGKGIRGDLFTVFQDKDNTWIGGGLECVKFPIMKMRIKDGITPINNFDLFGYIHNIFFVDSNNGWAVGSPSTILHFDGTSWEKTVIDDKFSSLRSVYFLNSNNGITVGLGGTILIFIDGKWAKEYSVSNQNLKAASIRDNTYYAIGDSGTIVSKTVNVNDMTSVTSENKSQEFDIYPNPCNAFLNIKLTGISSPAIIKLSVTNPNGQILIQTYENILNGNFLHRLNTSKLKNGLYYLQLTYNDNRISSKFIITH